MNNKLNDLINDLVTSVDPYAYSLNDGNNFVSALRDLVLAAHDADVKDIHTTIDAVVARYN